MKGFFRIGVGDKGSVMLKLQKSGFNGIFICKQLLTNRGGVMGEI